MTRLIKVHDWQDDSDVYIVLDRVELVSEPNTNTHWFKIDLPGSYTHVNEADARRVLAALEFVDPATLSPSELQAEWERTEAWFTRLGTEMTRRARGE